MSNTQTNNKTYVVLKAFGGHAKGDELALNDRQAQFLVTSRQIEEKGKKAKASGGAV